MISEEVPTRGSILRFLPGLGVAVAVLVIGFVHRTAVDAGSDSLAAADGEWLVIAFSATVLMWVAGAFAQLGSMPLLPPVGRLFAVQLAASFANHLLPAGSGGIAVNMRFMRRLGMSTDAAAGAVGLNALAGLLTHGGLLALIVILAPSTVASLGPRVHWPAVAHPPPATAGIVMATAPIALIALTTMLVWRTQQRSRARDAAAVSRLAGELRQLGAILRHPGRALALWGGSLAAPLLHTLILFAVLRSLDVPVTVGTVLLIYVVVSAVSALVPSPGAIGSLDVALVAGLAVSGVPSTAALASVLGYRLITVWLPLLPTGTVLALLLRSRII
ncbi:flippase-like domain-containing protein [Actinomadura darangshiensis]|uniref:Flippase-like domain-containing protein n=1 Tax=Actinomadura darangshiensis TaxID=705336 RepID=A0A4R5BBA3_9ACTN|nr:lysylphosphatidylglycerol synthase transmembrane domain-containing protein [Actinomadura darangshiensis]TDD81936.1 flippase-like domain-containing protein [Actinomadura darangshiensis]